MFFLRKIDIENWDGKQCLDAVSVSDLSTKDNDLSVWQIDDKSFLDVVGLTIAMTRDKLSDFYVVILDADRISELGLIVSNQPGESHYKENNNLHRNIKMPTLWEMGYISEYIHDLLKDKANFHYFALPELKDLLYQEVKNKRFDYHQITEKKIRSTLINICQDKNDKILLKEIEGLSI